MDTTQILYLVGAFILGFIVAWFAGRSGPKRALEESEATAHSLQRTVDDRARTISKLEGQLKEQQAQVQKLGADNSNLAALLKTSEEGLSDATAEVARLQTDAQSTQGDRLLLESELVHTRDAYASSRTRAAELTAKLAETEAAAEAAAIAAAATAMVAPPPDRTDEVEALTAQVETLQREVELARAATDRMSIRAAMRPRLTPGKRAEYVALADNPERVVMALHERDVAVADARTETEYLRRNLSTLTSAGAELATTLERRNREYQLLLNRLSDLTATESGEFATYAESAATRALPMMAPVGEIQQVAIETPAEVAEHALAAEIQGELDKCTAELAALKVQDEKLQANLSELQSELDGFSATKADLEAQLETRDGELSDVKSQLAALQSELDAAALEKAALQADLQTHGIELDDLLSRVAVLSSDLESIAGDEDMVVEPPVTDVPASEAEAATPEAAASVETDAAGLVAAALTAAVAGDAAPAAVTPVTEATVEAPAIPAETPAQVSIAKLAAGITAAVAAFKRKNERIAGFQQQLADLDAAKSSLESGLAEKEQGLTDTQGQLAKLQSDFNDRSVKFDALSLRSSSLEADLEISSLQRAKFEDQIKQVAAGLQAVVATYGDGAVQAAEELEAPPAEAPVKETATSSAEAPAAIEAPVAETPVVAEVPQQSALELLVASATAVTAVVSAKSGALTDAETQLAALQAQIAELAADKESITAELATKTESLADFEAQLQATQTDLGTRAADLDGVNLKLAALQGDLDTNVATRGELEGALQQLGDQLNGYLAEFGEAEAAPDEAEATEVPAEAAAATTTPAEAETAGPMAPTAVALAGAAAVGELLKRRKDAVDSANARIGELETEIGSLTSQKDDLETSLQEKDEQITDAMGQIQALQSDVATRTSEIEALNQEIIVMQADLEALNQQIVDLQTELDEVKAAKAQVEADLAKRDAEEIQVLDQKMADLQARLNETESARLALEAELEALNNDLTELGTAFDADDDESVQRFAQRFGGLALAPEGETAAEAEGAEGETAEGAQLAPSVAKVAGVAAIAGAIEKKRAALRDAEAQEAALQEQLDMVSTQSTDLQSAKLDLETQLQSQATEMETLKAQLDSLQQQFEVTVADRDALQAQLQESDSALSEVQTKLEEIPASLPPKTVSDFKAAASATAANLGIETKTTAALQDLAEAKYIGSTYEQRLYRAGAGTYWELAHLTDDDLQLILRLTDMQKLAVDFEEMRADARRLAEESDTVGLLWEGQSPDDFEPIQGIGKVFEQRLYSAGIRTYEDLANASEEQLADIVKARKPLEPDFASWIRQAKVFLEIRNG